MRAPRAEAAEEVADAVGDGSADRKGDRDHEGRSVADGTGGGDRVQLIRVVEGAEIWKQVVPFHKDG